MSVINVNAALERFDNDTEIYIDLIETFLEINPLDFDAIKKELQAGQVTEAMHRIHQLKGASLTLGAEALSHSAALLETLLRNKTEGDPYALLGKIKTDYLDSVRELGEIRDDLRKLS